MPRLPEPYGVDLGQHLVLELQRRLTCGKLLGSSTSATRIPIRATCLVAGARAAGVVQLFCCHVAPVTCRWRRGRASQVRGRRRSTTSRCRRPGLRGGQLAEQDTADPLPSRCRSIRDTGRQHARRDQVAARSSRRSARPRCARRGTSLIEHHPLHPANEQSVALPLPSSHWSR